MIGTARPPPTSIGHVWGRLRDDARNLGRVPEPLYPERILIHETGGRLNMVRPKDSQDNKIGAPSDRPCFRPPAQERRDRVPSAWAHPDRPVDRLHRDDQSIGHPLHVTPESSDNFIAPPTVRRASQTWRALEQSLGHCFLVQQAPAPIEE
jgi:hypothetical protein